MPKIVDHPSFRQELAARATEVFLRRGYSALGMREIATQLGVSKSALYHYFTGKQDLFDAASNIAVARMAEAFSATPEARTDVDAAVELIVSGIKLLDADFRDEMLLLADYLRTADDKDGASASVAEANEVLRRSIADIVGAENATRILALSFGFLWQRVLAPETTDFNWFEVELRRILS